MRKWGWFFGWLIGYQVVKQEARGLAVELARNTRPFGFAEKAKKQGEKAVAGDINKVFAAPSDAYDKMRLLDPAAADRFWANITNPSDQLRPAQPRTARGQNQAGRAARLHQSPGENRRHPAQRLASHRSPVPSRYDSP